MKTSAVHYILHITSGKKNQLCCSIYMLLVSLERFNAPQKNVFLIYERFFLLSKTFCRYMNYKKKKSLYFSRLQLYLQDAQS